MYVQKLIEMKMEMADNYNQANTMFLEAQRIKSVSDPRLSFYNPFCEILTLFEFRSL